MSRGQEILTGALSRLLAGGCVCAQVYTDWGDEHGKYLCTFTHSSSSTSAFHPLEQAPQASSGHKLPPHQHISVHLIRADSGPVVSSRSSLPAVCLKVRASSQLQQLNIKLAAAASPRAQLTQSIALHYSWGWMRWPLTEGWISTVPNFMGAGGRVTPSTTAYRQRK